ncbi:MAG: tRNA (adenosine(37)-N6)-threonylcarbamoyltransferase complex ATPase subunit type 1 TsaE [Patescibacteria group bacterium]
MKKFISSSSAETKRFAETLARRIKYQVSSIKYRRHALVFALEGELGSGKTTFVQGFFRGLGIKRRAVSPTFIIMRKVKLPATSYQQPATRYVYHMDAYRIRKPRELLKMGFKEILSDSCNIVLVEWAGNVKRILPKSTLWLYFSHGMDKHERIIRIAAHARA